MNTNANFLISSEDYLLVKAAWKKIADANAITPQKVIIYNALRGLALDKGFTATINPRRIKAGYDGWYAFKDSLNQVKQHYGYFYKAVSKDPVRKEKFERDFLDTWGIQLPTDLCGALEQHGKQ